MADAHPRGPGHAADGHRRRRPALRRLLARGVASGAHPRRRRRPTCATWCCRPSVRSTTTRVAASISGVSGAWAGDEVWVDFTSCVQPPSVYRYDYAADRLIAVPRPGRRARRLGVRDGPGLVRVARRDAVSMFIIHRKDLPRDGRRPVRLSGYGGFNISVEPRFVALNAAWLRAGRRARLRQRPRRRRIRPRLARGGRQDAAAERLRRLHRRGALARLGGLHDAIEARLARQQQRRSAGRRHRHAGARGLRRRLLPRAHPRHAAASRGSASGARRPSSTARPTIPSRAPYLAGYSPYHNVQGRSPLSGDGVRVRR